MEGQLKINNAITSNTVLLIDENGRNLGAVSRDQALYLASSSGLDLMQVSGQANPPVCRIFDFGKYQYQKKQQQKKQKIRQKNSEMKELRLRIMIQSHDLEVKLKKAKGFLSEGHKLRIVVILRGREMNFSQKAFQLIESVREKLAGDYLLPAKRMGKRIEATLISPKKQDEIKNNQEHQQEDKKN